MPRTYLLYRSYVTSLQRIQSLPATKGTEIVSAGIPHASSFQLTSRDHLPACPAVLTTRPIPVYNKSHKKLFLAGIPHASSFRFTFKKHPSCLAVLATPSPTTIDVAASRWLFSRCGVSFLQQSKPKLSGTYLQLLSLHNTKC